MTGEHGSGDVVTAVGARTGDALLAAIAARHPALCGPVPPTRDALASLVDGGRWRLVDPKPLQCTYEESIATGDIPTRDGSWHDAFNVLAFVAWPAAKLALHARVLQCQRARRQVGDRRRSREEDALALVDEVALVVSGPAALTQRFDAHRHAGVQTGVDGPQTSADAIAGMDAAVHEGLRVRCFGHALLEHLALRRPMVTAGVWTIALQDGEDDDRALASQIAAGRFVAPCVSPGIPWPDPSVLSWVEV